jgi:hypothetical protein
MPDFDIRGGIDEALNRVVTLPLPQALDPLITVAQELDTIALAVANGLLVRKLEELLLEEIDAAASRDRRREISVRRRIQAVRQLQSAFSRMKRERELKERKAAEDGWDPFFAVFRAVGPLSVPGNNRFELVVAPDEGADAFAAIVRPVFGGDVSVVVPVTRGTLEATLRPGAAPDALDVDLTRLDLRIEPYEIAPGLSSGPNTVALMPGSAAAGRLDTASGRFDYRFAGTIVNDISTSDRPTLFFAHAAGVLNRETSEVSISADDPMLVPLPASRAIRGQPGWSTAVATAFDAATRAVTFRNAIHLDARPRIALARYADGSYASDPGADPAVGAELLLDPLIVDRATGARGFAFRDSTARIRAGATMLLEGTVENISLDGDTGEFFGELRPRAINAGGSRLLGEIDATGTPILLQFSTGVGAFDLLDWTNALSTSADMPEIDLAHGTAGMLPRDRRRRPARLTLVGVLLLALGLLLRRLLRRP